ncbi:ADP-ribosylation/Crystallin J1 [Chthoniobacter flavus Ellin428]|uniref:ADP-ribosylation/Crystallin J1 n=1 Tax=Chthoniobacter flavus Ellin428 TaxID=497964 RepID=B4CZ93_9BACT|nr:ADP-ribosylglycohydrolase family protein [Chthoniobacter flavus]EDY20784.1 ADP-ribosylation/Crystallin J1 [Chthoniobacter flavus Ellin428]TCO89678.1 ADP-ribosylglycohydrolase [Chthoniobacter flavus]
MNLPDNHTERLERARLSLEGLAIGDAFGEMLAYQGASARERVERGLMAGPWFYTDDTAMALGVFEVLRLRGSIDPNELALQFAERFRREPERGYGTMARVILRRILAGESWQRAAGSAFGGTGSMGNGAAMRVAPLGAYFAEDLDTCLRAEAVLSAGVTHAHREGISGAIAIATAAAMAWRLRGMPKAQAAIELLQTVYDRTPDGETRIGIARAQKLPFFTAPAIAARVLGNGSAVTAPDTVPFVLWSAAKHLDDYREALIDTVIADGDCDTNCAMVGGIVALYAGRESIPEDWQAARERFDWEEKP